MGSFLPMALADALFQFPVSIWRLIGSLAISLASCYAMISCYDRSDANEQELDGSNYGNYEGLIGDSGELIYPIVV